MKFFAILLAVILISQISVTPAYSSTGWQKAKDHTAWVKDGYVKHTKDAVVAAAKVLAGALASLKAAQATLAAVTASSTATAAQYAAAYAAVQVAQAAVVAAEAALNAALVAAAAAAAAAAGFALGTGIYQLGWGSAHLCWDPVCPVVSNLTIAPKYSSITQDEIDLIIPELLLAETGEKYTKEEFMSSESGVVAWNYMSEGIAFFVNSYRGAAVSTEGRHSEVLQAVSDMNASLQTIPKLHVQAANAMETNFLPKSTLDDLKIISSNLDKSIQDLEEVEFTQEMIDAEPEFYASFLKAKQSVMDAKSSIDESIVTISEYYDMAGNPRPLVGKNGIFPPLTISDLQNFTQECANIGKKCLPDSEILIGNILLDKTNVSFPNYDFFEELAELDSQFYDDEEIIFGSSESVTLSHVLRTTGTTLSNNGMWLNIDLEQSPLTMEARSNIGSTSESLDIPPWIKQNAEWWADEQIDDKTFVQGIQWLIENNIMKISSCDCNR
ncbi:hypothetical protein [Nitrosopumilus sp.]|uniref:hypothetical protein n=1 Tax=Nitrosopumilus sp. TaxID=2024843 RepID=UPI003B5BACFB